MKGIEKVKIGDKIYEYGYYFGKFPFVRGYEVIKVNEKSFRCKKIFQYSQDYSFGETYCINKNHFKNLPDNRTGYSLNGIFKLMVKNHRDGIKKLKRMLKSIPKRIKHNENYLKNFDKLKAKIIKEGSVAPKVKK